MNPVNILLLEDSPLDAGLTVAALKRGSIEHRVNRVDTRDSFLEALESGEHDLILSDYVLPAFDGLSALTIARQQNPDIPFIFVSGAIGEDTAIESMKNGATDYVLKQRLDRLPSAVIRALTEARERRRRRQVEDALQRSEARYRTLVESITEYAIFMLDTEGRVTTWNPGAEQILGYAEHEILQQSSIILFTPEDIEAGAFNQELHQAGTDGHALDERIHVRKDGSRFFASGVLAPIRDRHGSLQGFVKVLRDVSERKRMEEELRHSNHELQQFAYAASHDMQEPLRTVNSYAQMLARRYRDKLDDDGQEFLGYIENGVRHMQLLLADLLSYSQLLHEREPRLRAVPLDDVLDQVLLSMHASIDEKKARITREKLPEVHGDESQLAQVFQNLVSNALKYQEPEGEPHVHVSARQEGHEWIISVRDNGIGFEPQYADRIFGLFRRLHRDQYPGTGIGLALCKRIIERHNGRIWAESEPGQGATFFVALR